MRDSLLAPAFHAVLVISTSCVCIVAPGLAQAAEPVSVGVYEATPFMFRGPSGEPDGFAIDVLKGMAVEYDWELTYVFGTRDATIEAAVTGAVDLMVSVAAEDSQRLDLEEGTEPLLASWGQVFVGLGDVPESLEDLEGRRLIRIEGDPRGDIVVRRLEAKNIHHRSDLVGGVEEAFAEAEGLEKAVVVTDRLAGHLYGPAYGFQPTPIIFDIGEVRFRGARGTGAHLVRLIDASLHRQKREANSVYRRSLESWSRDPSGDHIAASHMIGIAVAALAVLAASWVLLSVFLGRFNRIRGELRKRTDQIRREVKQRELAEEQLQHAQKMEAVGHLAAGLAHDFNNVLTIIHGYSDALNSSEDEEARYAGEAIDDAAKRAGKLTRQLLAVASKQSLRPRVLNPNELLGNLAGLLRRALRENVRLSLDLARGVSDVEVDSGQLEQVLLNLAMNARDAMPEGGTLVITTCSVQEKGQRSVEIRVSDTGAGIADEAIKHIFEPFFSTKGRAGGTGLGLAVAYGIVRQSGGDLRVERLARGTRFIISLPAAQRSIDESFSSEFDVSFAQPADHGMPILLVEDEGGLRRSLVAVLEARGFKVLPAASGEEALEIAARHPEIGLVVTDVIMPGIGGPELARALAAAGSRAPVLFMSGYAGDELRVLESGVAFLAKPFTPSMFLVRVNDLMDKSANPQDAPQT